MARRAINAGRKRHPYVAAVWAVAAVVMAGGFMLRILAPFWGGTDMRLAGILLIAMGIFLAAVGWLAERHYGMKPPP